MIIATIIMLLLLEQGQAWSLEPSKALMPEQRFFNFNYTAGEGAFTVVNKTTTAYATGFILASAFLAGTLVYNLEESKAKNRQGQQQKLTSRVDDLFSSFFSEPDNEASSSNKRVDQQCDCETYCTNKYYYGDEYVRKKR